MFDVIVSVACMVRVTHINELVIVNIGLKVEMHLSYM